MTICAEIGISIDTARFVPANTFFRNCNVTKERTVNCYEMVFFLKDGGTAVINGKKYPIKAGSVRFHRPGDKVYSYRFNEIYVVHFNVDNEAKGKAIFEILPSFITFPDIKNEVDILKTLITALIMQDDFECICSLWELLRSIKSQFQLQQKHSKLHDILQIKKYIDDNFHKQLTLDSVARNFFMHPVYMQRKFKRYTGITPAQYLKYTRLSKAKAYLLTTDLSVDYISELCGFCNTSYFISVFKKSENITPLQYRQKTKMSEIQL
ncbi:MAG: helix-turn-helix transcriptional regulator [Clostridia bacterium]|nr:helix-turn-helix transcriptional regulator [Clostridia bacterium]